MFAQNEHISGKPAASLPIQLIPRLRPRAAGAASAEALCARADTVLAQSPTARHRRADPRIDADAARLYGRAAGLKRGPVSSAWAVAGDPSTCRSSI